MPDLDADNLPELYTQREVDKTRKRQRLLGRVEGAAAIGAVVVAFTFIKPLLWVAALSAVIYGLYRMLKKSPESTGGDAT